MRRGGRFAPTSRKSPAGWSTTPPSCCPTPPDGRSLAVASNPAREVLVYPVAALLAGRSPQPQALDSAGALVRQVAFVRRGKDRGLRLVPAGGDPLVFEFGGGLRRAGKDWEI